MPLVELKKAVKTYHADGIAVMALQATDLAVEAGEFLCVAGPSGSGKTTLLHLLGAIDTPTEGEVVLAGQSTRALSRTGLARLRGGNVGVIFQSLNLIPVLTAYENVEYVLLLRGLPRRERLAKVEAALAAVGLADYMERRPGELSGGQQQRVAAARAIVAEPPLVLADEPTASLDSRTGEQLMDLLTTLNRECRTSFVFSSHDPRVVERARRIVTLLDGRVVEDRAVV